MTDITRNTATKDGLLYMELKVMLSRERYRHYDDTRYHALNLYSVFYKRDQGLKV